MTKIEVISNGLEEDSNNIQMGFLSLVYSLDYPFGKRHLVNIIKGMRTKKISEYQHDILPPFGIGSDFTTQSLASALDNLIAENFLNLIEGETPPYVMLTDKGQKVLAALSTSKNSDLASLIFTQIDLVHEEIIDYDRELLIKLEHYRRTEAYERQIAPCVIIHSSVLKDIARTYPQSIEELVSIKNLGYRLAEEYGNDILSIVKEHCSESADRNEEDTFNQLPGLDLNTQHREPNPDCGNVPPSIATENKIPIETTLQRYWNYPSFHPLQKEVIEHLLNGIDVLLLMATGGGKSLCYQLPAVHTERLTIVISPLIALMKDQVDDLVKKGIPAATINSSINRKTNEETEEMVRSGKIHLLYVSPEKFVSSSFLSFLHTVSLSMIAIDEAHCISMWGHDFRPEYRELSLIKTEFSEIPVIAMTATATKVVREDIVEQLGMKHPQVFVGSFNRQNLYYEIRPKKGKFADLVNYLLEHRGQSGIVYCTTRNDTERLAEKITNEGFRAIFYHAGLEPDMRRKRQEQFINNEVDIVCATIAFGMGIDKPDIRFVIHYNLPKSVEGYYQETGRAGRDGLPSDCILYYHPSDFHNILRLIKSNDLPPEQFAIEEQKLKDLIEYCELTTCRRKYLLNYFDEDYGDENCSGCDICLLRSSEKKSDINDMEEAKKILTALEDVDGRLSKRKFKHVITGYRGKRVLREHLDYERCFGICQKYDPKQYVIWIDELIQLGCIGQDIENRKHLFLTAKGRQVLEGKMSVILSDPPLVYPNDRSKYEGKITGDGDDANTHSGSIIQINSSNDFDQSAEFPQNSCLNQYPSPQDPNDNLLYNQLRTIQKELFQREDLDFTRLFKNPILKEIVSRMPLTDEEFLDIPGMTFQDWNLFHDHYLETLISFIEEGASPDACRAPSEKTSETLYPESGEGLAPEHPIDGNENRYQYDIVLYAELCEIRREIAESNGVFVGSVLYNKQIEELCINYPCSESDLAILWPRVDISSIQSNSDILAHISNYCDKHGITPPPVDSYVRIPRTEKRPIPSAYESVRLYQKGNSISEVAAIRKLSEYTISNHIASILRFESILNIDEIVAPDRIRIIEAALETVGDEYLKP